MKRVTFKCSILILALAGTFYCNAQSSIPRGTVKPGDSVEYKDDRSKHVHEEVTVIPVEKKTGNTQATEKTETKATDKTTLGNISHNDGDTSTLGNSTVNNEGGGVAPTESSAGVDKTLVYFAITIFGLTALVGMYLLTLILSDKKRPLVAMVIHGVFALTGIILLILFCVHNPGPVTSLVIFGLAALGGIMLFYTDVTGKQVPKWLAIAHAGAAITGFALLLVFAFSQSPM